jgi:2,3-bisphosphoglycerate-dependent phosphoglycerate mutase
MKLNVVLGIMLCCLVYACKEDKTKTGEDLTQDVKSLEGKYVNEIKKNTIYFEDGTSYKIDEKKYLKTFILTRHAEIDTADLADGDPNLSEQGKSRAAKLANIFDNFRIDAVYTALDTRSLYTVDSLCDIKSLPTVPYSNNELKKLVETVRNSLNAHNVLIVGYANTVPVLANFLYGEQVYKRIYDLYEYDNLLIIFENNDSTKVFLPLKYKP